MEENDQLTVVEPRRFDLTKGADPGLLHKLASDVAGACKDIVLKTAMEMGFGAQKRQYVRVEGWQAIANAFGCAAGARDVEKVYDPASGEFLGFRAIGEVRRSRDGMVIAMAEGFVGVDEVLWFGGKKMQWSEQHRRKVEKEFDPRPEYAIRAMAQTRAISRACRSAFAFVVVMISEHLDTTPAEEVEGGEPLNDGGRTVTPAQEPAGNDGKPVGKWQDVVCQYGTKEKGKETGPLRGRKLGALTDLNLEFLHGKFVLSGMKVEPKDQEMAAALKQWAAEKKEAS